MFPTSSSTGFRSRNLNLGRRTRNCPDFSFTANMIRNARSALPGGHGRKRGWHEGMRQCAGRAPMINELPGGGLTYLGVFILGLGLNLTPCVYPMLSVTLSLFKDKKHPGHW